MDAIEKEKVVAEIGRIKVSIVAHGTTEIMKVIIVITPERKFWQSNTEEIYHRFTSKGVSPVLKKHFPLKLSRVCAKIVEQYKNQVLVTRSNSSSYLTICFDVVNGISDQKRFIEALLGRITKWAI